MNKLNTITVIIIIIMDVSNILKVVPGIKNLYLIKEINTNRYKIGQSLEPLKRLRKLQTGNSRKLILVACCPGSFQIEQMFHKKYKEYHVSGEWFKFDERILLSVFGKMAKISINYESNDIKKYIKVFDLCIKDKDLLFFDPKLNCNIYYYKGNMVNHLYEKIKIEQIKNGILCMIEDIMKNSGNKLVEAKYKVGELYFKISMCKGNLQINL